jgi:hypothetical protein
MLWIISGVLGFLWLLGYMNNVGGSFIHLLLLGALVTYFVHYRTGRRTA